MTKLLGVFIDGKLSWKHHVSRISNKRSKCIGILHNTRLISNEAALRILYYSTFLPYVSYCADYLGNTFKSTCSQFFKGKKIAITIICGAKYLDCAAELFYKQLLTLFQFMELQTAHSIFKAFHQTLPQTYDCTSHYILQRQGTKINLDKCMLEQQITTYL